MKKIAILIVALLGLTGLHADNIRSGTHWYNGDSQFEATVKGGIVHMYFMSEGEESAFVLVPVDEDWRAFDIRPDEEYPDAYYPPGKTARYVHQEGLTVLMVYDADDHLTTVFTQTTKRLDDNAVQMRTAELCGAYSQRRGPDVLISEQQISIGIVNCEYEVVTFNSYATEFIIIKGGPWNGLWQCVATQDGWYLYESLMGEYGMPERKNGGQQKLIEWKDPETSRWDFASRVVLTRTVLYHYDAVALSLMRNSIMARHGYVFKSPELQQYFNARPWYSPRESNDDIQLSFIEQLNVQLIKNQETAVKSEE